VGFSFPVESQIYLSFRRERKSYAALNRAACFLFAGVVSRWIFNPVVVEEKIYCAVSRRGFSTCSSGFPMDHRIE